MVHGSTFAKNNLAMAAGIATLEVLEQDGLIENAARSGEELIAALAPLVERYEFLKDVRGRGLMIGLEFGEPTSLRLRASWRMLEMASKGLFCQMITVPLLTRHRVLSQVAGHGQHVVKFIPPLTISQEDCRWIVGAVEDVVAEAHRVPGAVWDLGKSLARQAVRAKTGRD